MEELKPCPFCGNDAPMLLLHGDVSYVKCVECGVSTYNEDTPDVATDVWNARAERTCRYLPDIMNVLYYEDGDEIETGEAHPDGSDYSCSNCGGMMMGGDEGWFDETIGEHGGIAYKPRFSYCPYCGAKVIKD